MTADRSPPPAPVLEPMDEAEDEDPDDDEEFGRYEDAIIDALEWIHKPNCTEETQMHYVGMLWAALLDGLAHACTKGPLFIESIVQDCGMDCREHDCFSQNPRPICVQTISNAWMHTIGEQKDVEKIRWLIRDFVCLYPSQLQVVELLIKYWDEDFSVFLSRLEALEDHPLTELSDLKPYARDIYGIIDRHRHRDDVEGRLMVFLVANGFFPEPD
jgi:hypothetical protein